MKIYGAEVQEIDNDHLTIDGNLVRFSYDCAPDGIGLTYTTIGWHENDHYVDIEDLLYEWLERQA